MTESLVDVPLTVILTHSHWDHMGAAHQFDDVRIHAAELPPDGTVRWDYVADEFHIDLGDGSIPGSNRGTSSLTTSIQRDMKSRRHPM